MAIIVEPESDIVLSREEYERLLGEYFNFVRLYSGPYVSFETFVKQQRSRGI